MRTILRVESLEDRAVPAASVTLNAGILSVVADKGGTSAVVQTADNQVQVVVNSEAGQVYNFDAATVNSISFQGGRGDDSFVNNTSLNSSQHTGSGKATDYLQGGTGTDVLVGGNGKGGENILFDSGGPNNTIVGGSGFNNIQGFGGSDTVIAGDGDNLIYEILGTNTIFGGTGRGTIISNATSTVFSNDQQTVVTFFQQFNGTSPFVLQNDVNGNGILYLNPQTQTGFSYTLDKVGNKLVVTYTDANGTQVGTFDYKSVDWIASFGTAGNDAYVNNTKINLVAYGAGGNDTLVGGFGINLLKGSSGNDTLVARGYYNDLSANVGVDTLIDLSKRRSETVFRAGAGTTVVGFDNNDVVTGVPALVI